MKRRNGKAAAKQTSVILLSLFTLVFVTSMVAQTAAPVASSRAKRTVLVSVPDRKLAVIEDGNVIATFSVAVGAAASPSPTGEFQIVTRVANPTYYHAGKVIPTGKDNPLGTRWLGLSQKGYGIHGTNAPSSVGHAKSHGCIRLRNRDAERLFAMLQIGDMVQIRGERDEQISQIFGDGADETTVAEAQVSAQANGQ
jgi:lipoprotein-anchoring transpeptidase ErfK/SrfK